MLGTVQCRPAAACATKSPSRVHSKETRQDKTRRGRWRRRLAHPTELSLGVAQRRQGLGGGVVPPRGAGPRPWAPRHLEGLGMVGGKAPVVFPIVFPLKDCFCFYLDVFTEN